MFFQSCLLLAFYEVDKCSRKTLNAGILDAVCIRESQHSRQYKLDLSLYRLVRIRSYLNAILCLINNKLFYTGTYLNKALNAICSCLFNSISNQKLRQLKLPKPKIARLLNLKKKGKLLRCSHVPL